MTTLITGGTRGIGLGLAVRLVERGERVLVTASSNESAAVARVEHPDLEVLVADLSDSQQREQLAAEVVDVVPDLTRLINNAGLQRRVALAADTASWHDHQVELDLLLAAPQHLCLLLVRHLLASGRPAQVVNTTSGGAFIPQPFAPGYSAAKAGLHSWTTVLRHSLAGTTVTVTELIPPAVATGLGDRNAVHGADVNTFCDAALAGIEAGRRVVGFEATATDAFIERVDTEQQWFDRSASRVPVETYAGRWRPS